MNKLLALLSLVVLVLLTTRLCGRVLRSGLAAKANPVRIAKGALDVTGSQALARLFDKLDLDHDGVLSAAEYKPLTPDGRDAMLDDDGDGLINRSEFALSFLHVNSSGNYGNGVFIRQDLRRIDTMLSGGLLQQALDESQAAIVKYPDAAEAWSLRGRVLEKAGKLKDAGSAHERALQITPDEIELRITWLWFALDHSSASDAKEAAEDLLSTMDARLKLATTPTARETEFRRAEDILVPLVNHYQDALHDMKRSRELLDWGLKHLGRAPRLVSLDLNDLARRGDRPKAMTTAREMAKDPAAAFAMTCFQARQMQETNQPDEAERLYRDALKLPARYEERMDAIVELYQLLGVSSRLPEADRLLRELLLPAATTFTQAGNIAKRLAVSKVYELAVHQVESAASAASGNPEHWVLLADLVGRRNERAARKQALMKALAQCGSNEELALQVRGFIVETDAGR